MRSGKLYGKLLELMKTQSVSGRTAESLRILLAGLVDYAGLFPPAALSMTRDVENFARYRRGEYSWMLNYCVVPATRLDEFDAALAHVSGADRTGKPWKLSVLVGAQVEHEIAQIMAFNDRHRAAGGACVVVAIEVNVPGARAIHDAVAVIPRSFQTYFEVAMSDALGECIAAIRDGGVYAKMRTGGVTPDVFPSSEQAAEFLDECAKTRVRFKATAGLHHPIRGEQRLTYESTSPTGLMFGFLNVFLAAAYVFHGLSRLDAALLLDERSTEQIRFEDDGVSWRGHRLDNRQLASARQLFCTSFGSCSFEEPVEDLRRLRLL